MNHAAELGLSADQVEQLHLHGYVVVEDLIDLATLDAVRAELHAIVTEAIRGMHAEGRLPEAYEGLDFDHQLARVAMHDIEKAKEVIARIQGVHGEGGHIGPAIFTLMVYPRLLDAMQSLVGPEIIGSSVYRIRPKAPGLVRGAVPWHQDSGYLLGHCDRELIITCWIPMVDATVENGCCYVLPDTHTGGVLRHHTGGSGGYLVIDDEDLPQGAQPIPVPVRKGGALIMTNTTPHASFVNQSDHMRWSVDLRYQSDAVPNNLFKRRDEIRAELPDTEIACYPPEKDFVVRSAAHPERVVHDWRELKRIRDSYVQTPLAPVRPGRWQPVGS